MSSRNDPLATDGVDGCYGDSGGPLMTTLSLGGNRMVGISSWGYDDCASYKYYGVYSRIDAASAWIYGIVPIAPLALQVPIITGLSQVGQSFACTKGIWDGSLLSFQYRFESSTGDTLQNGSSTVYLLSAPDVGKVSVLRSCNGSGGTATASSAFSAPVASW